MNPIETKPTTPQGPKWVQGWLTMAGAAGVDLAAYDFPAVEQAMVDAFVGDAEDRMAAFADLLVDLDGQGCEWLAGAIEDLPDVLGALREFCSAFRVPDATQAPDVSRKRRSDAVRQLVEAIGSAWERRVRQVEKATDRSEERRKRRWRTGLSFEHRAGREPPGRPRALAWSDREESNAE